MANVFVTCAGLTALALGAVAATPWMTGWAPGRHCPEAAADPACLSRLRDAGHDWSQKGELDRARALYARGAEAGDVQAMFHLAWLTEEAGGEQARKTAAGWYRKSAEAGFAPSMNNLGMMHARGLDGAPDHAEAFQWYRAAAEAGNPIAIRNLMAAYRAGRGTPRDFALARKWADWTPRPGLTDGLMLPTLPRTRLWGIDERPEQEHAMLQAAARGGHPLRLDVSPMSEVDILPAMGEAEPFRPRPGL